ncbi:MAG: hypothetical protein COU66_01630 [Candidatus Pacebacteria bacterium CG10_big_fil_rev_8_21_14_0_10_44_11]|nr:MAG: hypothetical protein COU66_01630 [Candidatus Pacebacteria bacterium CG10_big_fil_rev_8_21_14_0_10_44_11]
MPDIFDSSLRNDEQETLDHQRKLLRGIRTKRYAGRRAQKVVINQLPANESTMINTSEEASDLPQKHKRTVDDYSEVMRNERPSRNPFQAFAAKPFRTFFSSQHSQETIIVVLRKHPLTQVKWLVIAIVLALVPFLFNGISILSFLPGTYQFAGAIIWYLLLTGFIMESFLTWFFNVYIITDERIIDVDFLSLIYRNISTAKIDNIEDVTATTGGAVRGIFDFGTVQIQTAAEKREFEFEDVPHPNRVTKLINELILEEEREKIEGRVN